ncbi:MAG: flippase-like domain-containing protein [Nanoarchaeota archaeon]|nr:flippase-like domain-containing protein [Nanoarchaeota archaeon]MBU1051864.1 flippase-like domain-containing protein [Nanoarchaeota archaeon]MBU1989000.1 flippase-like domain-containing protein [Nanoarchaeota archaeon]
MRKRIGIPLIIIILALLFYTLKDINFLEVYSLLKQINPLYLILAILSYLCYFLIWNARWQHTMKGFVNARYFSLLRILFAGVFVNTITPGTGIGGEPVRAYYLKKKYKHPKTKFLGYILADKTFNVIAFAIFIVFSLIFLSFFLKIPSIAKTISFTILAALVIFTIILLLVWKNSRYEMRWLAEKFYKIKSIRKRFNNLPHLEKYLTRKTHNFTIVFKEVVTDKHKIYFGIILSIILRLFEYLAVYLIFLSLGVNMNFISIIVVVTLSHLLGDLSPTPGGIGVVEGSMILLYSAIGIPPALAAVVALLTRVIYYFYTLLLGGLSLLWLKLASK